MSDEQKPKTPKKASKTKEAAAPEEEGVLTTAAKAIGTAAGKIATIAGVEATPPPARPKAVKPAKLQKKNNPHVPRKLKKAQKKAELAKSRA
jgi:hypothetical protein